MGDNALATERPLPSHPGGVVLENDSKLGLAIRFAGHDHALGVAVLVGIAVGVGVGGLHIASFTSLLGVEETRISM